MSVSGKYQVIVADGDYIYLSSDFGVTFSKTIAPLKSWSCVTISENGRYIAAGTSNEYIYVSTDYGATWNSNMTTVTRVWTKLIMSGSGEHLWGVFNNREFFYVKHQGDTGVISASMVNYVAGATGARGNYTISGNNLYVNDGTKWLQFAGTDIGTMLP
jgi:hypothetical protein